jgi:hypothetical protein
MRGVPHDPASSARVREERLRAAVGLRPGALPLSAWRGRSGRRYVVTVHPPTDAALLDCEGAVVLAVARGEDGAARAVGAASVEPEMGSAPRRRWLRDVGARGACELHVHRLVDDRAERRAVVADLTDDADAHAVQPALTPACQA